MKTKIAFLVIPFSLAACSEPKYNISYGMCINQESSELAADLAKYCLTQVPRTLSGDDQDWEDAVDSCGEQSRRTACPPILVEYDQSQRPTGNVKKFTYADAPQPKGN